MTHRQICFDTETTGFEPSAGHRIVEIGCVEMIGYVRTGAVYHAYVNPQRSMPPEAQKVHGLSEEFLKDKPLFSHVADAFLEFIGDAALVAHNARFDMKFINHELQAIGKKPIAANRAIDTLELAKRAYPGQPSSLDALCRRFGIDLSARTHHGALLDAELLADVYLELMGGRQVSFGLQASNNATARSQEDKARDGAAPPFPRRTAVVRDEERAAHRAFIQAKIKNALWDSEAS
ncbi:MAG: DNA polymerase III subunit epsilon [Alphaproteobacteria bacterium]|nr:MAG: DNA polymerase III subunit epsilon [Alphaproteobacteria bacterium]TAF15726.1 MAG: DNA polymerase III subunit epsilon [Alphaproteobacteria bacterium]TAF41495.1 MAG: DNA polymerase III subunit epsilon [Alphaproteobacteria bacterium]TAF77019.1 MAG: DNA polymerase III subunit epsilon [Alphaproteobacteria bacterium]